MMLSIFSLLIGHFCIFFRVFLSLLPIFFFRDFLMWTIFLKILIEFVTTLLLFYVLVFLVLRQVGSQLLTRSWTQTPLLEGPGPPRNSLLARFLTELFARFLLLLLCCEHYLYTFFWRPSLIRYMICKYFLPFCGWSFPSLDSILWCAIALWVPAGTSGPRKALGI